MLELHVADDDVSTGSIAVGWCLSKNLLEHLNKRGFKDPIIVLVSAPLPEEEVPSTTEEDEGPKDITHFSNTEYRKVVRLKDLVTHVEFRRPGNNKIYGFITYLSFKDARDRLLRRNGNGYSERLISHNGKSLLDYFTVSDEIEGECIEEAFQAEVAVSVPDGIFAKKPSEFESKWLYWLSPDKPIDQCEFRRKRLFAYTIQPILFLLNFIVHLIVFIFAALFGARDLGKAWAPILNPLSAEFAHGVFSFANSSIFIRKDVVGYKKFIFIPFMPLISFPLIAIAFFIFKSAAALLSLANLIVGIIIGILLVCILLALGIFIKNKIIAWRDKKEMEPAWFVSEGMKWIVCSPNNKKPFKFNELPSSHRTFRLRFENLKAKICRPFSA